MIYDNLKKSEMCEPHDVKYFIGILFAQHST